MAKAKLSDNDSTSSSSGYSASSESSEDDRRMKKKGVDFTDLCLHSSSTPGYCTMAVDNMGTTTCTEPKHSS